MVFEEEHWHINHRNGKRTELVVQGNIYWLRAKVLHGQVDGKLPCAMDDVEMRALEDRAKRLGPSTVSSSTQPLNIRREMRFGVGVSNVLLERRKTCHTSVAVQIATCPRSRWTSSS